LEAARNRLDARESALQSKRAALENQRVTLEMRLAAAVFQGEKQHIKNLIQMNKLATQGVAGELTVLASRKRGLTHELSVQSLRKSGLEATLKQANAEAKIQKSALTAQEKAAKAAAAAEKKRLDMLLAYLYTVTSTWPTDTDGTNSEQTYYCTKRSQYWWST
jgi:hypothetical protein